MRVGGSRPGGNRQPGALSRRDPRFAGLSGAYEDMKVMLAGRSAAIVAKRTVRPKAWVCSGPIAYVGQNELRADIDNLKAALKGVKAEEAFVTAISPSNLELYYENHYYGSAEEYLAALADAMHVEYKAIVDAGFVLQIDDPRMATHYNRTPNASIEDCRKFMALRVEAVNHALRGIPPDRVRFHTCYSVNIAPRVFDFELKHFVDLMLQIRAGAYAIEAANPRHEHEWELWRDVRLPDDKILIPGVVSHCIHLVEHPELVAQRIVRFAERGRARKGDRRHRLRVWHLRRRRRSASRCRLGQAALAGRRRPHRQQEIVGRLAP